MSTKSFLKLFEAHFFLSFVTILLTSSEIMNVHSFKVIVANGPATEYCYKKTRCRSIMPEAYKTIFRSMVMPSRVIKSPFYK